MEQYLCRGPLSVVASMTGDLVRSATLRGDTESLILVIGAIDPGQSMWCITIGTASGPIEKGESK